MSRNITLNTIRINTWTVDVIRKTVTVNFDVEDDQGEVFYRRQLAVFWETIPDPVTEPTTGEEIPNPSNWYLLPAAHLANLTSLTQDATQALAHLINE